MFVEAYAQRVEEMRVTIEDLEAIKELNDELDETHRDSEKQLSAEVGERRCQLSQGAI